MFIAHASLRRTGVRRLFVRKRGRRLRLLSINVIVAFASQTTRDPEVWENPEDFRPERFLETTEGSSGYALRANCTSKLLSWGLGIRKCLGQQLSRHQLFIYASTIVRRCYVEPAEAGVEPKIPWSSETGLTIKPCPFNVRIRARWSGCHAHQCLQVPSYSCHMLHNDRLMWVPIVPY